MEKKNAPANPTLNKSVRLDCSTVESRHHLKALDVMLRGNAISVIDALQWDDVRLSATIYVLNERGIPVDSAYKMVTMPFTGNKKRLKHWFINFDLLGDEAAAKAKIIQRKVESMHRYEQWPHKINAILRELELLGYQPDEKQLEINFTESEAANDAEY